MNELANLAERLGATSREVRRGIGSDPRIGFHYPYAGEGMAVRVSEDVTGYPHGGGAGGVPPILEAVDEVNAAQKRCSRGKSRAVRRKALRAGIAVWGLAFKQNTDTCGSSSRS